MKTHIGTLAVCSAIIALNSVSSQAQTVIGSWTTSGESDGWVDNTINANNYDPSVNNVANSANFTTGFTYASDLATESGYSSGLQLINQSSFNWNQTLGIGLEYTGGDLAAFLANTEFQITFSVPAGTQGGTPQVPQLTIEAAGLAGGFQNLAASTLTIGNVPGQTWASDGNTVSENSGAGIGFNEYSGSPARSVTMTWNYSSLLAAIGATPGYVNLQLTTAGQYANSPLVFNNAELLTPVPEPASMALLGLGALVGTFAIRRRK